MWRGLSGERQIMLMGWWINYILEWLMEWGVIILGGIAVAACVVLLGAEIWYRRR